MTAARQFFDNRVRPLLVPAYPWSRKTKMVTFGVAALAFVIIAVFGSGADFFGCYTRMVTGSVPLSTVAQNPWTQNPPWQNFFMAPFVMTPGRFGYYLFLAATIAMVLLGSHYFHGHAVFTLLSSQMFWVLYWGQLEGWGILGLVLAWQAVESQSWLMMFFSLAISSFKPQVSLVPVLYLWWTLGKGRWKAMAGLAALFILSMLIWGPWPVWYAQDIFKFVGQRHYGTWNASLGWIAVPLYIPALLLPMERRKRLIALTATTLLASPYLPFYTTLPLLVLEIPWWIYPLAFLGYLPDAIGTVLSWNAMALISILALAWLYAPYLKSWWKKRQNRLSPLDNTP